MRTLKILLFLSTCALAQAPDPFPSTPLPIAVAAFGEFNQLGNPRFTMGVSAIYPIAGSIGMYGTTTADILPKLAIDPLSGRKFYAISSSVRQGFHKTLLCPGRLCVMAGGDVGPSFSQAQPSGISVSFSTSAVITTILQLTPTFSFILPVRMLYLPGIGWNPVIEAGFMINLKRK